MISAHALTFQTENSSTLVIIIIIILLLLFISLINMQVQIKHMYTVNHKNVTFYF